MTPFSGTSGPFSFDRAIDDLEDEYASKPYEPPSPRTRAADFIPYSIPIPVSSKMGEDSPLAGPSSEGALNRRASGGSAYFSPASAPAVASAVAVAHPSLFIHTHHPRRGSLTPLGLNVISPVPPIPGSPTPIRSVGFSPSPRPFDPAEAARRASTTSTSSTLTQSRPSSSSNPPPLGFQYRDTRRPSLTPSIPTLAPVSPTRTHAPGRTSRPTSSDGLDPLSLQGKLRASEHASKLSSVDAGRRGSMPHLNYGGWTGHAPRQWSPSLPPPPSGSVDSSAGPEEGYRFGEALPDPSSVAETFENSEPFRRRSSASKKPAANAFEEMEAQEAERQRRAFLDATYGQDGRRARERLSFAASSSGPAGLAVPRRPSLALWERISLSGRGAGAESPATAKTEPVTLPSLANTTSLEDLGPRRGSLPVPIPGSGTGRSPPRVKELAPDEDAAPQSQVDDLEEAPDEEVADINRVRPPQRPLPPLLPLSDPGPRLLPSTLALHRANHLLNSRNLQAEPLPAPLPPSLHPPAPVDLAEFDIDFILAGSQAQLGGNVSAENAPVDALNSRQAPPTLKLGEGEDSFAKFVGEFDDEYGDRRGEWTFRPSATQRLTTSSSTLRAEWDCSGGGTYEIHSTGEVRSLESGSVWKVQRTRTREYELEEKARSSGVGSVYVLTSKSEHNDRGGIKTKNISLSSFREHMAEDVYFERGRMDSTDSGATARAGGSSSIPILGVLTPKKKPVSTQSGTNDLASLKAHTGGAISEPPSSTRVATPAHDEKKKGGFGGALKRAIKSTLNSDEKKAAREERERERLQSQSWSPSGSRSKDFVHPSGKGIVGKQSRSQTKTAPAAMQDRKSRSPTDQVSSSASSSNSWLSSSSMARPKMSPRTSAGDESITYKPGKAWDKVPDEAIAMVIPIEEDGESTPPAPTRMRRAGTLTSLALIVWYVPFNSEAEAQQSAAAATSSSTQPILPTQPSTEASSSAPSSLPKFQKLLRRQASKDKDSLKKDREGLLDRLSGVGSASTSSMTPEEKTSSAMHPLPFRGFRIVAKIADIEDVLSEPSSTKSTSVSFSTASSHRAPSTLSSMSPTNKTEPLPQPEISPSFTDQQEVLPTLIGAVPAGLEVKGRDFATVIAVCHSRSSGVEFVLEGLDRLGFCEGESAWGPTGYEEWRGTGLSEKGRECMDQLWAGCVCVMGLAGL